MEKERTIASPSLGTASTPNFEVFRTARFDVHPRGIIPSPACESRARIARTGALTSKRVDARLLAIREAAPKPRSPASNYIIKLF